MKASVVVLSGVLLAGCNLAQGRRATREPEPLFAFPEHSEDVPGDEREESFAYLPGGTVVRGTQKNGVASFKGLRFAQPPVGDLRWAPPAGWAYNASEVVDATAFRSACVQGFAIGRHQGSEDCLFLNVWTPADAPTVRAGPASPWQCSCTGAATTPARAVCTLGRTCSSSGVARPS